MHNSCMVAQWWKEWVTREIIQRCRQISNIGQSVLIAPTHFGQQTNDLYGISHPPPLCTWVWLRAQASIITTPMISDICIHLITKDWLRESFVFPWGREETNEKMCFLECVISTALVESVLASKSLLRAFTAGSSGWCRPAQRSWLSYATLENLPFLFYCEG